MKTTLASLQTGPTGRVQNGVCESMRVGIGPSGARHSFTAPIFRDLRDTFPRLTTIVFSAFALTYETTSCWTSMTNLP